MTTSHIAELIKVIDELRHLDGIKGNFYVNETEYLAPTTFHDRGKLASEFIGTYYIDSFSDFSSGLILKRFVC
jgi:hypothetical protein